MAGKASIRWSKKITPCQVLQLIRAERDVKRALMVFDAATAEHANGFKHDHTTYRLIISRLASANQFRSAEMLLNRMKEEECTITEDIFLSICKAYGQAHKPLDALRVFNKLKEFQCEPTPTSYLIILDILGICLVKPLGVPSLVDFGVGGNQESLLATTMQRKIFFRYVRNSSFTGFNIYQQDTGPSPPLKESVALLSLNFQIVE
ncbi:hypothetical protein H6P81_011953 [Aristolochia fimbriata]|uniref:Pentatricopeptide repeat-containing protein n=1 Tax=Aristolochia fimbriata TaxID=158543 RepID=A0AAV7ECK8_ARIFI|nr:hypothetical protein H6P81_011953 [Aristolochia fimbriata]